MKFSFYTLGCKVNQYETQAMQQMLLSHGHTLGEFDEPCDGYIVNSCTVTAVSDKKTRNAIRRAQKLNPDAAVGVCGCYAQSAPDEVRALGVDVMVGTADREAFVLQMEQAAQDKKNHAHWEKVAPSNLPRAFEQLPAGGLAARTRALLKIEDGCNNFCTYCIIPYARGRVRSLPVEQALEQTARLADAGVHEIVLTGIEIASYGRDFDPPVPLTALLERLLTAQPNVQLRLGSLDPRAVDEAFCERLRGFDNLARHFHLSMQSGCDSVLRRMNRHYTTEEFYGCVERLRAAFPDCSVTTDLIVGFPGETEDEFEQTLAFLERCAFASVHVFPYSVREGTKAAAMPGQLDQQTKADRAERAKAVAERLSRAYRERFIGRTLYALPEHPTGGLWAAHGRFGFPIYIKDAAEKNRPVAVKVTGLHKDGVLAQIEN